jgi:hypothetical protein
MLGGAGVGLSFLGLTQLLPGTTMNIGFWPLLFVVLDHLLSGAICGWIYWRIARERTSLSPDAIEAG